MLSQSGCSLLCCLALEYVTVSPFEEVPAFGDATDSQSMDVDAALNDVFG